MKKFAIIVVRDDGSAFVRSYHRSLGSARRIANDLNSCPFLSLRTYKVYDFVNHCYC